MPRRVHRKCGRLKLSTRLSKALIGGIAGEFLNEVRAVPDFGVEVEGGGGLLLKRIIQPDKVELAAVGRELGLQDLTGAMGDAARAQGACARGLPGPVRIAGDININRRHGLNTPLLPCDEQAAAQVGQARRLAEAVARADPAVGGGTAQLVPGRGIVLTQVNLLMAGGIQLRPSRGYFCAVRARGEIADAARRGRDAVSAGGACTQRGPSAAGEAL